MARGQRRGSNKNKTGGPKKAKKKIKKLARVEKAKEKLKKREAARRAQTPTRTAFERAEVGEEVSERRVGTAVILAHGAGGSSSHASMRAWRHRLVPLVDEVRMVDYARPYQMESLVATHREAVRAAIEAGHKEIVLVGCSMGARVALHMLTSLPPAEGAALPQLEPELRACIRCQVALGYPLLRVGTQEVRDGPIRALRAEDPPILFVSGDQDPHMSFEALKAACACTDAATDVFVVRGADATLSSKVSSQASAEALDDVLAAFLVRNLAQAGGAGAAAGPAAALIGTTPDVQILDGGLEASDLLVGDGPEVAAGLRAKVQYSGKLADGKRFDAGEISFRVGDGEVIKGWDQGVLGMRVGGKRLLRIPPHLGYGVRGSPPTIPPNATLLVELRLLSAY